MNTVLSTMSYSSDVLPLVSYLYHLVRNFHNNFKKLLIQSTKKARTSWSLKASHSWMVSGYPGDQKSSSYTKFHKRQNDRIFFSSAKKVKWIHRTGKTSLLVNFSMFKNCAFVGSCDFNFNFFAIFSIMRRLYQPFRPFCHLLIFL